MNEFYMEQLVPRKVAEVKAAMIKNIILALTVVMFIGSFMIALCFPIAVVLVVVDIFLMKSTNVEYEYMYLNGDLDIDKVIAKQKRKHLYSVSMSDVVVIAPKNSGEVRPFQNAKTLDYSSGVDSDKVYKMVVSKDNQNVGILIEPNEALLNGMKMLAPRKVYI
ncbi:MAG: DUF6106 family protein [Eubacteriales bacterium]